VKILNTVRDVREYLGTAAGRVGFVPTMGNLHKGHLSLVRMAREQSDVVLVSIYVNPPQFNKPRDFASYPRTWDEDRQVLEELAVDAVFLPDDQVMYPDGFATTVHIEGVTDRWEGEHRPGHFDGVCTVVAKLFNIVQPHAAFFGEKDYQQLQVIRQLVRDLDLPVEIKAGETIRAAGGLALSSRNYLLSPDHRSRAPRLKEGLDNVRRAILAGGGIEDSLENEKNALTDAGFQVDYLALVDGQTLEPVSKPVPNGRLLAAACLGAVRLIDNISL